MTGPAKTLVPSRWGKQERYSRHCSIGRLRFQVFVHLMLRNENLRNIGGVLCRIRSVRPQLLRTDRHVETGSRERNAANARSGESMSKTTLRNE